MFFAALLAVPWMVRHFSAPAKTVAMPARRPHSLATAFRFRKWLTGRHRLCSQGAHARSQLDGIMPEVASMGASVSIVDYDRDGWPDIYVTNSAIGSKNHLYRNNHDGTFTDVAEQMGIADVNQPGTGVSMGAVWGDYDNDGYEDLFLIKWGKPELFHNDQGSGFTRVTDQAGLPPWINANTASGSTTTATASSIFSSAVTIPRRRDLWHLHDTTRMMPDSFEYAKNGGRKYLFHNLGNGHFEEVSAKVGIDSRRWALAAAAADLRGTGYPDLIHRQRLRCLRALSQRWQGHFTRPGQETALASRPRAA
jgi:enediyne biosynthesis protein E4